MSRDDAPKDNGWVLKNICHTCGWIGTTNHVCPCCGHYYETMSTCVVRWVSTYRWYHYLMLTLDAGIGYWEKEIDIMRDMCIKQGYVPKKCMLTGELIFNHVSLKKDPCIGCNENRIVCGGRIYDPTHVMESNRIIPLTMGEIDYFCQKLSPIFVVNRNTCYMGGSFGTGEEGKSKFTAVLEK